MVRYPLGANVFLRLVDLLVKIGELVDKLFDEDEELMKSWVSLQSENDPNEDAQQDIASSLLEAATQLRSVIKSCDRLSPIPLSAGRLKDKRSYWICVCVCVRSESPEGLEVYLHSLQLLTTVEEGMQALGEK